MALHTVVRAAGASTEEDVEEGWTRFAEVSLILSADCGRVARTMAVLGDI